VTDAGRRRRCGSVVVVKTRRSGPIKGVRQNPQITTTVASRDRRGEAAALQLRGRDDITLVRRRIERRKSYIGNDLPPPPTTTDTDVGRYITMSISISSSPPPTDIDL